MGEMVPLGLPGVEIPAGTHLCVFHAGPAGRDEVLVPYLQGGLRAGDKCVGIVATTGPTAVLTQLGDPAGVAEWVAAGQLEVRHRGSLLVGGPARDLHGSSRNHRQERLVLHPPGRRNVLDRPWPPPSGRTRHLRSGTEPLAACPALLLRPRPIQRPRPHQRTQDPPPRPRPRRPGREPILPLTRAGAGGGSAGPRPKGKNAWWRGEGAPVNRELPTGTKVSEPARCHHPFTPGPRDRHPPVTGGATRAD